MFFYITFIPFLLAGTANVYKIYRKTIKIERKTIKLILFNDKKTVG